MQQSEIFILVNDLNFLLIKYWKTNRYSLDTLLFIIDDIPQSYSQLFNHLDFSTNNGDNCERFGCYSNVIYIDTILSKITQIQKPKVK